MKVNENIYALCKKVLVQLTKSSGKMFAASTAPFLQICLWKKTREFRNVTLYLCS